MSSFKNKFYFTLPCFAVCPKGLSPPHYATHTHTHTKMLSNPSSSSPPALIWSKIHHRGGRRFSPKDLSRWCATLRMAPSSKGAPMI